jgi:predicted RNA-binding protein with PIN domain
MPIAIDGNNLLHTLPHPHRSRDEVRRAVLDQCRREKMSVIVVFDGPPPSGVPTTEHLGRVTVLYSESKSADDVIIGILGSTDSAQSWSVVTNDRGLAARARERGASIRTVAQWMGRRGTKSRRLTKVRPKPPLRPNEVRDWEHLFSEREEPPDDEPSRVYRPKRRR